MPILTYIKDIDDERDFKYNAPQRNTPKKIQARQSKYRAYKWSGSRLIKLYTSKIQATESINIDYRKYLSPVKDQGNLGSCVGFAATALKEFHENFEYIAELSEGKRRKREKEFYDLSEQWTYWNAKKIDPWGPSVEGTSIRYALKVLQKIGCPPEDAWKYTDDKINIGEPESWSHMIARWNTIESYWRVDSVSDMISALQNDGPVLVGVGCYEEIFRPQANGFVPYPADPENCYGGHALLVCGYDETTQRFLFKNSWGLNWGDNGYGWFGYDYMRDFCWDAWVAKDHRVTRAMIKGSVTL